MKKKLIIIGIIVAVIAALVIFFAMQATPGNVLNVVRAESLEAVNGTITIPEKYTVIDAEAFANKAEFNKVIIKGETEIRQMAFYGCQNLSEVVLESACEIGESAFANCPSLTIVEVRSPDGGCMDNAFDGHGGVTILCHEGSAALQVAQIRDLNYRIIEE